MARTSDPYDPTPNVAPTTGGAGNPLSVRANPNDMGDQIGESVQNLGKGVGQVAEAVQKETLLAQGRLNETLTTNADSQLQIEQGKILSKYKTLEGLNAGAAYESTVAALQKARQDLRDTMPNPAAQRAYDTLTLRSTGYAIRDVSDHSATQMKKAFDDSQLSAMQVNENQASNPRLPDAQFENLLGTEKHLGQAFLQSKGVLTQDTTVDKNGDPVFSDTPEGQEAKNSYEAFMNERTGAIWSNKARALATDLDNGGNPIKAYEFVQKNFDRIPAKTRSDILNWLARPVKDEYSRQDADAAIGNSVAQYNSHMDGGGGYTPKTVFNQIQKMFPGAKSDLEHGAGYRTEAQELAINPKSGGKGYHPLNQAVDISFPGADLNLVAGQIKASNPNLKIIVEDYKGNGKNGRSTGPHLHIQWEKPDGSKLTDSGTISPMDWERSHITDILDDTEARVRARGGDQTDVDTARARATQRIQSHIMAWDESMVTKYDNVRAYINGTIAGHDPITNPDDLMSNDVPADVRASVQDLMAYDPLKYNAVLNIIKANASGVQTSYGTNTWSYLQRVLSPNNAVDHIGTDDVLAGSIQPGHNVPLTNTGYGALAAELQARDNGPQGRVFADAELKFFNSLHEGAIFRSMFPNGAVSPELEKHFNDQLPAMIKLVQVGRQEGKTAAQLFSPKLGNKDNPDFIGNHFIPPSAQQVESALMSRAYTVEGSQQQPTQKFDINKINSIEELQKAINTGQIKDKKVVHDLIVKHGWDKQAEVPKF